MADSSGADAAEETERPPSSRPASTGTEDSPSAELSLTAAARRLLESVRYEESPEPFLERMAAAGDDELERRPALFESRLRFFRTPAVTVAGVDLSLDDIEHGVLRGGRSKYGLGYLPRLERTGLDRAYRLEVDPRIHFALNCGAASCPAVLAYDPDTVDETLDYATRSYLDETVEYDAKRHRVRVPQPCLWFAGDFGGRSGIRDLLRRFEQIPPESSPSLRFQGYDWTKEPRQFET